MSRILIRRHLAFPAVLGHVAELEVGIWIVGVKLQGASICFLGSRDVATFLLGMAELDPDMSQ